MAKAKRGRGGRYTKAAPRRRAATYRTRRRSTRAGGVRKTARRAYQPKRRARRPARRRSNPAMFSPATRYALYAAGGAVGGFVVDMQKQPDFLTNIQTSYPTFGRYISNSTVLAAVALGFAQFVLKGDNKRNLTAAGLGLLVPVAAKSTAALILPEGGAAGYMQAPRHRGQIAAPAPRYASCPTYSNQFIAASSGLNVA